MRKSRLSVYLDQPLMDDLSAYAARQKQSLSLVAEAAIAAFVSPDQTADAVLRRLNRMDRLLQKLERDNAISSEALLVFVWNWLLSTPALPEAAQASARASATERYDAFMETLGRRIAKAADPE
jgi:hypothetical protein